MADEVNTNRTDLDQQQIFQRSFDESKDRIRVDAEISASIIAPPGLEVSISAVDDNIAIRNSNNNNELLINPDGSINVNSSGGSSDINISEIDGVSTAVNNGVANNGTLRVVIASDNTPFTVNSTQSGTWNINNISGTISLPTGASTSALQTTGNTSLASIDSKLGTLGQKNMDGSVPVVISSDQSAIPVTGTFSSSLTSDRISTGSITASAQTITLNTQGAGTVTIQIGGTGVATVVFEQTTDGTTWWSLPALDLTFLPDTTYYTDNSSATTSLWQANCAAVNQIRIRSTAYTSGTLTVSLEASVGTSRDVAFPANIPVAQGTAGSNSNAWTTRLVNSFNNLATYTGTKLDVSAAQFGTWTVGLNAGSAVIGHVIVDSGTIAVTQSTSPWVTNISQFGGSNVVTGLGTSGSGIPRVTVSNDSNILASQSGTWNINNISGTITLPTDAAKESTLSKLSLSQASITSGQSGPLVQGATTTSSPTYLTGQTNPLSLTTTGALRTDFSTIAGAAIPTGNGVSTIATQRVNIAADNTAFSVNAAQSGSWTISGTSDVNLKQFAGVNISLGQQLSSASIPVVLASDYTGSVKINDHNGNGIFVGSQVTSNSLAVAIATDQTAISTRPLGAATQIPQSNTEGSATYLSQDLKGNLRVTLDDSLNNGTTTNDLLLLILQELQAHRLLMSSVYGLDPMSVSASDLDINSMI